MLVREFMPRGFQEAFILVRCGFFFTHRLAGFARRVTCASKNVCMSMMNPLLEIPCEEP